MRLFAFAALSVLATACGFDSSVFGEPGLGVGGAAASSVDATGSGATGLSTSVTTTSVTTTSATTTSATSGSGANTGASTAATTTAASTTATTTGGGVAVCGNGVVDGEEQCDDFNTVPKDGCSPTCVVEGSANQCPTGAVIKLTQAVTIVGTTDGLNDIAKTSCGGPKAPDVIYQIEPTKTAPIKVELTTGAAFDRILSVRLSCNSEANTKVCSDSKEVLTYTFPDAQVGVPFYVMVSGHSGSSGAFSLRIAY